LDDQNQFYSQSSPFDTVTPKKAALRAEIFNSEVIESLFEPDDEELDDDEDIMSKFNRRGQK